jgi:hypothetical protein
MDTLQEKAGNAFSVAKSRVSQFSLDTQQKLSNLMKESEEQLKLNYDRHIHTCSDRAITIGDRAGWITQSQLAAVRLLQDYASYNVLKGHFATHHGQSVMAVLREVGLIEPFMAEGHYDDLACWEVYSIDAENDCIATLNFNLLIDMIRNKVYESNKATIDPSGRLQNIFNFLSQHQIISSPDQRALRL